MAIEKHSRGENSPMDLELPSASPNLVLSAHSARCGHSVKIFASLLTVFRRCARSLSASTTTLIVCSEQSTRASASRILASICISGTTFFNLTDDRCPNLHALMPLAVHTDVELDKKAVFRCVDFSHEHAESQLKYPVASRGSVAHRISEQKQFRPSSSSSSSKAKS